MIDTEFPLKRKHRYNTEFPLKEKNTTDTEFPLKRKHAINTGFTLKRKHTTRNFLLKGDTQSTQSQDNSINTETFQETLQCALAKESWGLR